MSDPNVPDHLFDWEAAASALMASKGITTGLWRLGVKLQFAALTAQWNAKQGGNLPTAMLGVESIALFKADAPGPMVFNAEALAARRLTHARANSTKPQLEVKALAKKRRALG
jgi:hypothetical protein